ncbi:heat stress transcription factor C-1-like [Cynara cardunculus var. scolymus]|uniref:Heat shock factor (HSF)-type, DNA-binding n=1 Tax=Cynara cardunculus var. scolymus TaxID=59895 RepID=A0A103Y2E3_CYNCS|nr:heat stress transcription factor C-1-like [Cynara cardunculus var. scolymus]KVI01264.1 Heat shock factor (HSF)-type, DNA-binding [Cynara cardunculus var. scolymus]
MESNEVIAPFVMKTYQMVNDSSLDNLIRWGTSNNSFIVVDSLDFSQRLLPAYFKHNNFSSFIRQLNTYGFRKVDPDRWEFANEWFLRGQVHLLKNIERKRQVNSSRGKYTANSRGDDEGEEEMVMEIARLKQEQKALEEELIGMNKRLEATERRPEQMMALLCKVAEDPEILPRMMLEKVQRSKRLVDKKRQRRLITPPPPFPSSSSSSFEISNSIKREEDECYQMAKGSIVLSPEGYCSNEPLWRSSPSPVTPSTTVWPWNKDTCGRLGVDDDGGGFSMELEPINGINRYAYNTGGGGGGGGNTLFFGDGSGDPDVRPPPPYPFSLLGGGL